MSEMVVLVEVGVATCRPPRTDAFVHVWLAVERTSRTNVLVDAETTAPSSWPSLTRTS